MSSNTMSQLVDTFKKNYLDSIAIAFHLLFHSAFTQKMHRIPQIETPGCTVYTRAVPSE